MTARSNGHSDTFSSNFFPNPSGSLIPRVKKKNNAIYIAQIRAQQQMGCRVISGDLPENLDF